MSSRENIAYTIYMLIGLILWNNFTNIVSPLYMEAMKLAIYFLAFSLKYMCI